jgi:hypothetical protein
MRRNLDGSLVEIALSPLLLDAVSEWQGEAGYLLKQLSGQPSPGMLPRPG